jgi:hypothetical protein
MPLYAAGRAAAAFALTRQPRGVAAMPAVADARRLLCVARQRRRFRAISAFAAAADFVFRLIFDSAITPA